MRFSASVAVGDSQAIVEATRKNIWIIKVHLSNVAPFERAVKGTHQSISKVQKDFLCLRRTLRYVRKTGTFLCCQLIVG